MHSMPSRNDVTCSSHNDSRWNGEQVMVSDLSFMSETFLSFRHSVQDAQVYLLQEQQCKDLLAVVKQNRP